MAGAALPARSIALASVPARGARNLHPSTADRHHGRPYIEEEPMARGFAIPDTTPRIEHAELDRRHVGNVVAGFAPFTYALMRVGAGLLFMQHGMQKLFGAFGGFGGAPGGTAQLASQMGLAGVIELVGGALLLLGLFTRPVALIMAIEMMAAYVMAHLPKGGWPIENGGELALLYAVVFLFFFAHGAGPFSLDRNIGRSRHGH
jgi:putative oxidoreductase